MIFFLADLFVSNPLLNIKVEQIKMGTNTSTHEEFGWGNSCGFEVQPSIGPTFLQFLGRLDLGFILLVFPDLSST